MRWRRTWAALVILAATSGSAQETATPARTPINDEAIITMCGGQQAKMFALFGVPQELWADRGATEAEDDVFLGYGTFGFKVRDEVVRVSFFFKDWAGSIRGIRIGDSYAEVAKVLGDPPTTFKNKEGVITAYGYDLKDLGAYFFTNFKAGKVWRVEVSLK
jgi:hypothetical protein